MWDLDRQLATPAMVKSILKTFISTGGQMFQGNVCEVETLKEAQAQPERYENLMVRIGGYSGRFTSLGKELQEEIIGRHRHKA